MKICVERLLVESSKLQDHRQQSCVICNVTVDSVGGSNIGLQVDSPVPD